MYIWKKICNYTLNTEKNENTNSILKLDVYPNLDKGIFYPLPIKNIKIEIINLLGETIYSATVNKINSKNRKDSIGINILKKSLILNRKHPIKHTSTSTHRGIDSSISI